VNKTLLYFLLAIGLSFGAWWTFQRNQHKSTIEKLDLNFSVPDTASISKIIITQKPGETAIFERTTSSYWKLNGKYNAAPQLMELLLSTIRNVEMQRPLPEAEKQTVEEALKTRNRKVEIFVKGELYKTYFVGDDAPNNKGTYFKLENGDPYVCFLRGFNGFLTPRYHIQEHHWRDRLLISSTPQTLQSVAVSYSASPVENFKISFSGKYFHLDGAEKMDTNAAADYLLRFKRVYIEQYLKQMEPRRKDSLIRTTPEWTLSLVDIDPEKTITINFYPTQDLDRTIAYLPKTQEMIAIQNRNLEPLKVKKYQLVRR
jgi:hypothetical protein